MDPITTNIIIPTLVNISSSFLSDLLKEFGKRPRSKTISNSVQGFIGKFIDTELDSGGFVKFLEFSETARDFVDYVYFCAYNHKYQKKIKSNLNRDSFILSISQKAVIFVQNEVDKKINIELVKSYFNEVMDLIENLLMKDFSDESFGLLYFVGNSIKELEERILESIKSKTISKPNCDYEFVKQQYLSIIKMRNKKSHVYGLDDIDLYSFYVFPNFIISENNDSCLDFTFKDFNHFVEEQKKVLISINKKNNIRVSWTEIFKESNIVSIIGGAGSGKSIFLKNIINKYNELNIHDPSSHLPIYCDLKLFSENSKKNNSYSIEDFLTDSMVANSGLNKSLFEPNFLQYFLNSGRCIILLDALDEVEYEYRQEINDLIISYFSVTNKHNKIIITSRTNGFTPKTRMVYEVCKVDIEQITVYVEHMVKIKQFNSDNVPQFLKQCEVLISGNFLTSMLMVSLLIQIYKAEKELPENKIDLYEKCVEYISKKREKDQKKSKFDFKLMYNILDNNVAFEKLSWLSKPNNIEIAEKQIKDFFVDYYQESYASKNETKLAIDEFLSFCSQRTELYVSGNQEQHYKFFHRSFFEFFYAKCIINEFETDESLFTEIMTFSLDSEIFELVVALLKKHNYNRFKTFLRYIFNLVENKTDFINENDEADFLKICSMINTSNQAYYCDKIYSICFNQNKLLEKLTIDSAYQFISPYIFRKIDLSPQDLLVDCFLYYKEKVIASYVINYINGNEHDMYFGNKSNIVFSLMSHFYSQPAISTLINEYPDSQLSNIVTKNLHYPPPSKLVNQIIKKRIKEIKETKIQENIS